MSGAIDLAAVKARSEAAARAATAPAPTGGEYVIDATEANFQTEVLDRSFQVPVLLDLWAEWCEPCKQLSPILEKIATESAGSWILAKVDVEANQRIAQMLQVQSIPSVFAVIGGQLVPGFQGALPEPQVREFITALLQAAQQAGLAGAGEAGSEPGEQPADGAEPALPPGAPEDERFTAAEAALEAGDFELAVQSYQAILSAEPANTEAQLALLQVNLLARLATLPADAVEAAAAAPNDLEAQLAAADAELASNLVPDALSRLIGLVRRLHGEERQPVRDRLVEYFDLLGPDDPRVAPARRDLANALF
ncbi:MAG: tetratricopeptide repeat protein [Actinomycetota bacterium]|nr:tetratricopeptide repeat protein [Actinomycetota bacterium]MDQ2959281.1 tetratricopeptide repeat protein [Actinomycetota bacterium]